MQIEYVEVSLSEVLDYFQKDFTSKAGVKISSFGKPLVDTAQGRVMFVLYVETKTTKRKK